jgi:hypothetical protein
VFEAREFLAVSTAICFTFCSLDRYHAWQRPRFLHGNIQTSDTNVPGACSDSIAINALATMSIHVHETVCNAAYEMIQMTFDRPSHTPNSSRISNNNAGCSRSDPIDVPWDMSIRSPNFLGWFWEYTRVCVSCLPPSSF